MISLISATSTKFILLPTARWETIVRIWFSVCCVSIAGIISNRLIMVLSTVVGLPKLTDHAVVQEVAAKHGPDTTTAQVLIAWGAYRGISVIPKSVHEGIFTFLVNEFAFHGFQTSLHTGI
jgi:hypothetical protein